MKAGPLVTVESTTVQSYIFEVFSMTKGQTSPNTEIKLTSYVKRSRIKSV